MAKLKRSLTESEIQKILYESDSEELNDSDSENSIFSSYSEDSDDTEIYEYSDHPSSSNVLQEDWSTKLKTLVPYTYRTISGVNPSTVDRLACELDCLNFFLMKNYLS